MWLSDTDFNKAHNFCATKNASALKSGRHAENEKHVVWNLYQTSFDCHRNGRAVITLMDHEWSWGHHSEIM